MPTPGDINVVFPPLSGGEEAGFNDAGIEQFLRDQVQSLVREITQNSTDAPITKGAKVRVEFHLLEIPADKLPFIKGLHEHANACLEYVSTDARKAKEAKAIAFFKKATKVTSQQKIRCLLIRDFNTTGLIGNDDDESGRWHTLVKTRGSSNKTSADSGGSFGIGKNAPFACSALRTVIYGTRSSDGSAWQGKCLLITHLDPEKKVKTQGVGFIGKVDGESQLAIRDGSMPCAEMKRSDKEFGTDILIVGFEHDNWVDQLAGAAVKHFWPALSKDKVSFVVQDHPKNLKRLIDKDTLDTELGLLVKNKPIDLGDFETRYVGIYKSDPISLEVKHLGPCNFYLNIGGQHDHTRKVCCFRNNKMVIEYMSIHKGGNYSAVFECENEKGSSLLKNMEPPRHDEWLKGQPQEDKEMYAELYDDLRAKMREQIDSRLRKLIKETTDPDDIDLNVDGGDTDGLEGLAPLKINIKDKKQKITIPKKSMPKNLKDGMENRTGKNGGGNTPMGKGQAGLATKGEKIVAHGLRCLLNSRNASSCTYRIPLPKDTPLGPTTIRVQAIGFDGITMEVEINNPPDGIITLNGNESSVEIEVKGESMALQATFTQKPATK